ncbi:MAG: hypothetical protein WBE74_02980 [Terracidiphilus sp.]
MAGSGNRPIQANTASQTSPVRLTTAQSRRSNRLQDAVYREMLLLESRRPGSEMGLALALLRAMVESEKVTNRDEIREWLTGICPLCLKMIEGALYNYPACAARED